MKTFCGQLGMNGWSDLNPSLILTKIEKIAWFFWPDCKGRIQEPTKSWRGFHGKAKVVDLVYKEGIMNKPWRFSFLLEGWHYFYKCPLLGMLVTEDYLKDWLGKFNSKVDSEKYGKSICSTS